MKFGKRLQEEMVEQWGDSYVNYKALKRFISHSELSGVEFSRDFFTMVAEELEKAETLFKELLEQLQQSHDELLEQDPNMPLIHPITPGRFYRKRLHRGVRSANESGDSETFDSSRASSVAETAVTRRRCIPAVVQNFFCSLLGILRSGSLMSMPQEPSLRSGIRVRTSFSTLQS
ncbi:sodium/sulfate symporter [Trypanosoma rangeli]|uniref:Sodium/sulfate symporter n=1 Tax=Trypanosoma rangeli TaxID=5698 RepID=A0A3R7MKZ7_TRYRA|nr:sodium/sulfate symporter [Trypanosoma rangeli]RNF04407.1 sodium/sulfate symporter [Trypanosoma rangeli]|eukprot:RNF04407.1 sodium/sulfate symporter [Trypanosoma rangeli]